MKLIVDKALRTAKMRAHSAAHLLNYQLNQIIPGTKQSGSRVDEDTFRFDFSTNRQITNAEILFMESEINNIIYQGFDITIREMSYPEAIKLGAKAFFEDKYGDIVRVVLIGQDDNYFSLELCGGTHCTNTSQIGAFKILSQESVASGIRRITAITGPKISIYASSLKSDLDQIADKLKTSPSNIIPSLIKNSKDFSEIKSKLESYQTYLIPFIINQIKQISNKLTFLDYYIDINQHNLLEQIDFKELFQIIKNHRTDKNFLCYNHTGNYGIYIGQKNFNIKEFLLKQNIKGGGNNYLIQGRDTTIINII